MAQYGDPYGDSSNGDSPNSSQPAPGSLGAASGRLPEGDGLVPPARTSGEPRPPVGYYTPSPEARRRNEWRRYQRLEPTYRTEPQSPQPSPPQPPNSARPDAPYRPAAASPPRPTTPDLTFLALTANPRPQRAPSSPPPAPRPTAAPPPAAASPAPIADHRLPTPGYQGPMPAPPRSPRRDIPRRPRDGAVPPVAGSNSKVTTLHPRHRVEGRRRERANDRVRIDSSSPERLSPERPGRERPSPERRTGGKLPLPALYLIRLLILGVGVAAIAGTLLSVLSPANLAESPEVSPTATPTALPVRSGATHTDAVALTSEFTRLKTQLEQLGTLTPGLTQSLFLLDVGNGRYVDIEGSTPVAAASTIKVPLLVAFLQAVDRGEVALNQALELQQSQVAGGSGSMQTDPVGNQYTALAVATAMIVTSDNTATNMMIDLLGGQDVLNQQFADWGLAATVLRNPLPDLEGTNTTSPRDLALLLALVDQGDLLSLRSRDRLFAIMQRTQNRGLIPAGVGNDGTLMANKTGDIGSSLGDVALLDLPNGRRYVLATLVQRPNNDGRAGELIRRAAQTAHAELSQPLAPVGTPNPVQIEEGLPSSPESTAPADAANPTPDRSPAGGPPPTAPPTNDGPPVGDQIPQG